MLTKEEQQENEKIYNLHIEAGLAYAGLNAQGQFEWIGTDKDWDRYQVFEEAYYREKEELKNN